MKRSRRVSIEFEYRKLTFSLTHVVPADPHPAPGAATIAQVPLPPVCPDCGAEWITVTSQAGQDAAGVHALHQALRQRGLHLHISLAGELSICTRSFEELSFDDIRPQETRQKQIPPGGLKENL